MMCWWWWLFIPGDVFVVDPNSPFPFHIRLIDGSVHCFNSVLRDIQLFHSNSVVYVIVACGATLFGNSVDPFWCIRWSSFIPLIVCVIHCLGIVHSPLFPLFQGRRCWLIPLFPFVIPFHLFRVSVSCLIGIRPLHSPDVLFLPFRLMHSKLMVMVGIVSNPWWPTRRQTICLGIPISLILFGIVQFGPHLPPVPLWWVFNSDRRSIRSPASIPGFDDVHSRYWLIIIPWFPNSFGSFIRRLMIRASIRFETICSLIDCYVNSLIMHYPLLMFLILWISVLFSAALFLFSFILFVNYSIGGRLLRCGMVSLSCLGILSLVSFS